MTLNNYNELTYLKKHVQNVCNSPKLIIQDNLIMCKILLITFKGSIRAWYNNLKPGLVISFNDLCLRIIALIKS